MKLRKLFINEYTREAGAVIFFCFRFCMLSVFCTGLYGIVFLFFESANEVIMQAVLFSLIYMFLFVPIKLAVFIPLYLLKLTPEVFNDSRVTCVETVAFHLLAYCNDYLGKAYYTSMTGRYFPSDWQYAITFIEIIALLIGYHFVRKRMKKTACNPLMSDGVKVCHDFSEQKDR